MTEGSDFIPYNGEAIIYERPTNNEKTIYNIKNIDYQLIKIGDGVTPLPNLPFINELSDTLNITSGSKNGTITVAGKEIYVKGLDDNNIMCFEYKSNYVTNAKAQEDYNTLNDKIEDNKEDIQNESIAREELEQNLQRQINAISGNGGGVSLSSLSQALDQEKRSRENSDGNLQNRINDLDDVQQILSEKIDKDILNQLDSLSNKINDEETNRKKEDEKLDNKIQEQDGELQNLQDEITNTKVSSKVSISFDSNTNNYTFIQDNASVGIIKVPQEKYLINGSLEKDDTTKTAILKLNSNNISEPVLVNLSSLIDTYTPEANSSQIQLSINGNKNISAALVPGAITGDYISKNTIAKDNLSSDVQRVLTAAELILGDSIGSVDGKFNELKQYIDNRTAETGVIENLYGPLQNTELNLGDDIIIPQIGINSYGKIYQAHNIKYTLPILPKITLNDNEIVEDVVFYAPYNKGKENDMLMFINGQPNWISSTYYINQFLIWENIQNKPIASVDEFGLIKTDYIENGYNYAVKLDDDGRAYVSIPWMYITYTAKDGINLTGTTFTNSGVRSISTGTTNGSISVNTNGTIEDISVKGLGSAAYTNSNAYDPAGSAAAVKNELLNGAGAAYDTLKELGDLISVNNNAINALNSVAAGKADKEHTHNYAGSSSAGGAANSANKLNTNNGSATQPVYFNNGVPVATTYSLNKTVPSDAKFTDTTYSANNGVGLSGTTFYNSGVRAISTGGTNGTITVNTNGTNTEVAIKGLGSNAYNSTAYLPLAGGTVTGVTTFSNTTASSSTTTGAVKISGGLGVAGTIYGKTVYGSVYNDYAEYRSSENVIPGNCIYDDYDGAMKKTTKRLQPACKIVSDTFGFAIGQTEKCKTPTAVCGRVLAIPYEEREAYSIGDCVCSGPSGTISKMTREEIINYPDRIVGIVSEIPNYTTWGEDDIQVNGRIWIYVR